MEEKKRKIGKPRVGGDESEEEQQPKKGKWQPCQK
jgi:hypothetical protein